VAAAFKVGDFVFDRIYFLHEVINAIVFGYQLRFNGLVSLKNIGKFISYKCEIIPEKQLKIVVTQSLT
jgi:hypothetical protein